MILARAVFFVLAGVSGSALAGRASQPLGCLIEPYRVTDVGSQVIGVIESIHVERGEWVRKGQVIAMLRSDVERAAVAIAASRVQGEAEVQAALAAKALADQKLERSKQLVDREFLSKQALDQGRAEAEVAQQKLAQVLEQKRLWERELELAQAQLELRRIRSPSDGVIADRYLSPGERIEEKPIVRIATIDPLRVEVVLPSALFGTIRIGDRLTIAPDVPNAAPRSGRVVLVDKLVDGPSNTFRVRLALANPRGELPAGVRCRADLGADAVNASSPAGARPPALRLNSPGRTKAY
jgi:RND family efflux transporter MFP subunit